MRMRRPLVIAAAAALAVGAASPAVAVLKQFHTPSGNIHCMYVNDPDLGGVFLECDVYSISRRFHLEPTGRPTRSGRTDVINGGPVLAYGKTWRGGPFVCVSRTAHLECRSTRSGHGFRLSKQSQKLF